MLATLLLMLAALLLTPSSSGVGRCKAVAAASGVDERCSSEDAATRAAELLIKLNTKSTESWPGERNVRHYDGQHEVNEAVYTLDAEVLQRLGEAVEIVEELHMSEHIHHFNPEYKTNYVLCDDNYPWWRDMTPGLRAVCLASLLSIEQRWICHEDGFTPNPFCVPTNPADSDEQGSAGEGTSWWPASDEVAGLDGSVLVAVASAEGEAFRQRRVQLNKILTALGVGASTALTVSRDMVAVGGALEACRPVRPGEEVLPNSYIANGLNQMHLYLHASRAGFNHILVLEDDVLLAPLFSNPAYARQVLREVAAEAPADYDLIFLGDCCALSTRKAPPEASRVGRWLFATQLGSRCSNAYLISARGMRKMLLQLPLWCSLDFMMNAAKFATSSPTLQTRVYVMQPPLFLEGSKTGQVMTTVEPGTLFGPGGLAGPPAAGAQTGTVEVLRQPENSTQEERARAGGAAGEGSRVDAWRRAHGLDVVTKGHVDAWRRARGLDVVTKGETVHK